MTKAKLTTTISKEEKKAITILIEKGMFENYSDFGRRAVARFLKDIGEYAEKKKTAVKVPRGPEDSAKIDEQERAKNAEDIAKFADSLF